MAATVACGVLLGAMTACGAITAGTSPGGAAQTDRTPASARPRPAPAPRPASASRVPGIGDMMWEQVPAATRQVVAVYGDDEDSPDGLVVLYERRRANWERTADWRAHNGRLGWTTDHRMDDERSPVGVFTLSDAGGTLDDPGSLLRYRQDAHAFASPADADESHRHDFDYVIAIDYNRLRGTPPYDWSRPLGEDKGGGIWLHLDHGDGTSGCVTIPESGMRTLLRTLDPLRRPVVVMGDREYLRR
ncbi:L,D-transpeptidase family protein [Streptomyces sp. NBC_01571]|uniref:L,D-transpeptidase family protein n=1 Tax=Streptomyces sp. NBC_01571 TaxID=2975883 RepID=UPI00224D2C91|nr:L,D-transpeptidase family protein [Streptomyces sp. NBC_01571]MCX4572585.1 L,D-transpeptidase family protein [Streptomyces sp. NBC_01571]